MNAKILILIALAFTDVYARTLNQFGQPSSPSFGGNIFEQFQGISSNPFYGFSTAGGTTQTSSTESDNGFAQGEFSVLLGANNTEDGSGTVSGNAQLTTIADDIQSLVSLTSQNYAGANGPGVAGILGSGFGNAEFGDSNVGFGVFVDEQTESEDAEVTADFSGFGLAKEGYSTTGTSFCVGTNCP